MRFDAGYRAHPEEMVGGADTIDNKGGTMATKKKKHGNLIITKMKRNLRLPAFRPSGKPNFYETTVYHWGRTTSSPRVPSPKMLLRGYGSLK